MMSETNDVDGGGMLCCSWSQSVIIDNRYRYMCRVDKRLNATGFDGGHTQANEKGIWGGCLCMMRLARVEHGKRRHFAFYEQQ